MLTVGDGQRERIQIGRVAGRLTDWLNEHRWNIRLDTGQVVAVQESELFLITH
jgi:hypothetical protein